MELFSIRIQRTFQLVSTNMKKVGANCGYWEKSNLCERQQGEERICPYHGTGSD